MSNEHPDDTPEAPQLEAPQLEAPSLGRLFGRGRKQEEQAPTSSPEPAPLFTDEPVTATLPVPDATPAPAPALEPEPEPRVRTPKAPRPALTVDSRVATAVVGLLVGLLVVVLTAGALRGCEAVRGVSSCGGGPGFVLLVAVMVSMVVLGGILLRFARVPDPTSTSFLAVGLLCVIALLFLVESLEEWWMIIVIPLLSVVTYLLSHWVTTAVIDPAD